jgi:hypothetical protein
MPLQPLVIRQGDHLDALAARLGFDADAVWNDPKNSDLRKLRKDPAVLCPGDILYVPQPKREFLPVVIGSTNSFTATLLTVPLHVVFRTRDGDPLANEPYVIDGLPTPVEGTTDGDGAVLQQVPVTTEWCRLTLTKTNIVYTVLLGHLDPVTEPSGVKQRLGHLGFYYTWLDRFRSTPPDVAIRAFQSANGIEPTGKVDKDTATALKSTHGT